VGAPKEDPFELEGAERRFIERAFEQRLDALRPLSCARCGASSVDGAGWQARVTHDEPPELALYCPRCAEIECGTGRRSTRPTDPEE
jgi:hypothetical protein